VREITALRSNSDAATRIAKLTDEQWTRTQADILVWEANRYDNVDIVGAGVSIKPSEIRAMVRKNVRIRLGLPEMVGFDRPVTTKSETVVDW
jgi:hypothetical protein